MLHCILHCVVPVAAVAARHEPKAPAVPPQVDSEFLEFASQLCPCWQYLCVAAFGSALQCVLQRVAVYAAVSCSVLQYVTNQGFYELLRKCVQNLQDFFLN